MRTKITSEIGPTRYQEIIDGFTVHVITGYDIGSNRYPVHLVVTTPGKPPVEVLKVGIATTEQEAVDFGFTHAAKLLAAGDFTDVFGRSGGGNHR